MIDAISEAQKIAFAPFTFQAVRAALNLGILKALDDAGRDGISAAEIENRLNLTEYTVTTLLSVLTNAGIVSLKDNLYTAEKIAQCFLYDTMTRINMNFVNDVCYQGAFYLQESFVNGKPEGLKVFGNWATVYEGLSQLPENARKSWFDFDHFYSDNAFSDVIKIMLSGNPEVIYDIGANTGKFELAMFSKNYEGTIVLFDLPQQLAKARENLSSAGYEKNSVFCPVDVLNKNSKFDGMPDVPLSAFPPDAILMSQFLDCFSKEQITSILKKAAEVMTPRTRIYILEPFWDEQNFDAAKFSLTHTSLYFTSIANGISKMYSRPEMEACAVKSGLKILEAHKNIGNHGYTLLECAK
jgi:hypothetical protein